MNRVCSKSFATVLMLAMNKYTVTDDAKPSSLEADRLRTKEIYIIADSELPNEARKQSDIESDVKKPKKLQIPRRYITCALACSGMMIAYSLRINLSMAVVAMTSVREIPLGNGSTFLYRDFDWTPQQKGFVLGSFFYGYVLSELPIGLLSSKYGGVTTLGISIACSGLFSLAIPFIANYGAYYVAGFRALIGVVEGGTFPSIQAVWSKWAPPEEKTTLVTVSYAGIHAAHAIALPIFGFLAERFGWQSLFYVPGIWGILWSIVWFANVKNDPADDARITEDELNLLKRTTEVSKKPNKKQIDFPWKEIITSVPIWMIIVAYFSIMWSFTTVTTFLPTVLHDIWGMDLELIGILICLPYVASTIVTCGVGFLSDYLRNRRRMSTTTVRKICQCICGFGTALFVFLMAFSNSALMSIASFAMLMLCEPFCFGSFIVNCLDLSPAHSGIIMGMASTVGTSAGVFCCYLAAEITSNKTMTEWCIVFCISGVMCVVSTVFYLLFADAELQPWAYRQKSIVPVN